MRTARPARTCANPDLFLERAGALASAVLVTTVTDGVGLGLFLGLATLFMPLLA